MKASDSALAVLNIYQIQSFKKCGRGMLNAMTQVSLMWEKGLRSTWSSTSATEQTTVDRRVPRDCKCVQS